MMNDKPNVGLVDSHAEGDGCDDNLDFVFHPWGLDLSFFLLTNVSMVKCNGKPTWLQIRANLFAVFTRHAVDDTWLPVVLREYLH